MCCNRTRDFQSGYHTSLRLTVGQLLVHRVQVLLEVNRLSSVFGFLILVLTLVASSPFSFFISSSIYFEYYIVSQH